MTSKAFVKMGTKGDFVREASRFRNWVERDASARFPAGTSALSCQADSSH